MTRGFVQEGEASFFALLMIYIGCQCAQHETIRWHHIMNHKNEKTLSLSILQYMHSYDKLLNVNENRFQYYRIEVDI